MTKKRIEVSIEEDILEQAKKQIPNMSNFFQNCLEAYLGTNTKTLFYVPDAQKAIDTIRDAQTALFLLTEREKIEENIKKANEDEIRIAWMKLYAEYRDTKTINQDKLKHAVEVLGVNPEELTDIVEVCYVFSRTSGIDVTEWTEVYNEYGEGG